MRVTTSEASAGGAPWQPPTPPAPPTRSKVFPPTRQDLLAFAVSALVGLAIWLPTMAMQPRYDYSHQNQQGSPWYFPLMIGAVLVLTVVFRRQWRVVAPGLIALQLVLAPFTTPRGDNDGLWVLIVPIIVVFGAVLALVAWLTALVTGSLRRDGAQPRR